MRFLFGGSPFSRRAAHMKSRRSILWFSSLHRNAHICSGSKLLGGAENGHGANISQFLEKRVEVWGIGVKTESEEGLYTPRCKARSMFCCLSFLLLHTFWSCSFARHAIHIPGCYRLELLQLWKKGSRSHICPV